MSGSYKLVNWSILKKFRNLILKILYLYFLQVPSYIIQRLFTHLFQIMDTQLFNRYNFLFENVLLKFYFTKLHGKYWFFWIVVYFWGVNPVPPAMESSLRQDWENLSHGVVTQLKRWHFLMTFEFLLFFILENKGWYLLTDIFLCTECRCCMEGT